MKGTIYYDFGYIAGIFNLNKFCIAFANLNQLHTLY